MIGSQILKFVDQILVILVRGGPKAMLMWRGFRKCIFCIWGPRKCHFLYGRGGLGNVFFVYGGLENAILLGGVSIIGKILSYSPFLKGIVGNEHEYFCILHISNIKQGLIWSGNNMVCMNKTLNFSV